MKFEISPPVYPITDGRNGPGWPHSRLARAYLEGGARFFQVRAKELTDRKLLEELRIIGELCDSFGARFVVNDRVDLVLASDADGVHLGQEDLPVTVARQLLGKEAVVGISTHNERQFEEALALPVDYIAVGPVAPTRSKADASPVLGPDAVGRLIATTSTPVVAIGGVTPASASRLWALGAAAVAVISDVNRRSDPGAQIEVYCRRAREATA